MWLDVRNEQVYFEKKSDHTMAQTTDLSLFLGYSKFAIKGGPHEQSQKHYSPLVRGIVSAYTAEPLPESARTEKGVIGDTSPAVPGF